MDFIIDFFRGIDGWFYYIMLVFNTIFIFAIIGYLGDMNNDELLNASMNMGGPDIKGDSMNLNSVRSTPTHNNASIPTVSATPVQNNQNNIATQQPVSQPVVPFVNPSVASVPQNTNTNVNNVPVNNSTVPSSPIPVTNPVAPSAPIPTTNSAQAVIQQENNVVDTNEKAPAVLVINSSDMNKDVK